MSLQLHRVASGLFIENALDLNIRFQSAEYMQAANEEEAGGYWGEFTHKPNAHHNAANKKAGGKLVRHNVIMREHIVLYDVRVVLVRKPPPHPAQEASYICRAPSPHFPPAPSADQTRVRYTREHSRDAP